jgi:DNA polymerase-3 subunit delta'
VTRPGSPAPVWDRVVGQPAAVTELARAAADPAVMPHAWLVTGPAGSGRSLAARAFAAALQCTDPEPGCGRCAGCHLVLAGSHPDVMTVVPEGLSLGVDAVRRLVVEATLAPALGRWRVLVLEDADRLTEQAANVLLKPLEEPGSRGVFLLCAPSTEDLLPTVRSRCRLVTLRLPATEDVAAVLGSEGVDPALAFFAAAAAQGHVGRARRLAHDEPARLRRAEILALPRRLGSVADAMAAAADVVAAAQEEAAAIAATRDEAETAQLRAALGAEPGAPGRRAVAPRGAAGALKDLEKAQKARATRAQRDALDRALLDLAALYRDVLVHQVATGIAPVHADQVGLVAELARGSRPEATLRRVDAVLACREAIAANVAPRLAVEAMALALRG